MTKDDLLTKSGITCEIESGAAVKARKRAEQRGDRGGKSLVTGNSGLASSQQEAFQATEEGRAPRMASAQIDCQIEILAWGIAKPPIREDPGRDSMAGL